jgi:hypothetical protein
MKIFKLMLAWLWVALPLGWGVSQSIRKAAPLFAEGLDGSPAAQTQKPQPRQH